MENKNTESAVKTGYQGFGSMNGFMRAGKGNQYLNTIAEKVRETIKDYPNSSDFKVLIVNKEQYTNLLYSAIVVTRKVDKVVYYYVSMLECTGDSPFKAKQMMDRLTVPTPYGHNNYNKNKVLVWTTSDALDSLFDQSVLAVVTESFGAKSGLTAIRVDGTKFRENGLSDDATANNIAMLSFNAFILASENAEVYFNVTKALEVNPETKLLVDVNLNRTTLEDPTGAMRRSDFIAKLTQANTKTNISSPNSGDMRNDILAVSGFIDLIAKEVPFIPNNMNGMNYPVYGQQNVVRLQPHIILNNLSLDVPTVSYAMLAIATSLCMLDTNRIIQTLAPKQDTKETNIGALNLNCNIGNDPQDQIQMLDLTNPALGTDAVYQYIAKMLTNDGAILSIDVENAGPEAVYLNILIDAAAGSKSALEELVKIIGHLTNGIFGGELTKEDIFLREPLVVPTGHYDNNEGERDLRDIDLTFIANAKPGDPALLAKWVASSVGKSLTADPFIDKVDVISAIVPEASISKATRITFNPNFIQLFTEALVKAGFKLNDSETININTTAPFAASRDAFSNAGIGAVQGMFNKTGYSVYNQNGQTGYTQPGFSYGRL